MPSLNSLLFFLLIKKLIQSGKQSKSITIQKQFFLLTKDNNLFLHTILKLIVPVTFKIKQIGHIKYQIPILTHYYKSINLALT